MSTEFRSIADLSTAPASADQGSRETLYDRLGGAAAVSLVVEDFYDRIFADVQLKPFFEGVDRQRLLRHQAQFLTFAFGGPARYHGRGMRAAHAKLVAEKGLNPSHFDMVAGHLVDALNAASVPQAQVAEVVTTALSVKPAIFPALDRPT